MGESINYKVSGCIVLYKQSLKEIEKTIQDLLNYSTENFKLFLIDNSPDDKLSVLKNMSFNIQYIHNPKNPGFGAAHNIAIKKSINEGFMFHFVINPDVRIYENVIKKMLEFMDQNDEIGMMMPKVLNEDGTIQTLPKLLPTPYSILMRKLKKPKFLYERFIEKYELQKVKSDLIYNSPILSGCFTLLRLSAIKEVGLYDDRFFMYFEDWDLSRRMHQKYKTIYFPKTSIVHGYESGANKNFKLFRIFISSAIKFFNKWGWLHDKERDFFNREALSQFN